MPLDAFRRSARTMAAWRPEQRDAVLYAASALFAAITINATSIGIYRQWGELAVGPYMLAALASVWAARRAARADEGATADFAPAVVATAAARGAGADTGGATGRRVGAHWSAARAAIFLFVLAGATLLPLTLEVSWRFSSGNAASTRYVQPEALVVERTGALFDKGRDPYQSIPSHPTNASDNAATDHDSGGRDAGSSTSTQLPPGQPAYDVYNPYGPLMPLLGLLAGTDAPRKLTDARIAFSLVTLLLAGAALLLCRGRAGPRIVALQALTVLPTAALPLATGGDDLPVAAVLLLGVVLLRRRQVFLAGLVLGFAAGLKFTAWPLVALAVFVARDRRDRRGSSLAWTLAGICLVLLPASLPDVVHDPHAFVENVFLYPLGLGSFGSPAASPLPGHLIVSTWPHIHRAYAMGLGVVGLGAIAVVFWRRRPRSLADALTIVGWFMAAGVMLAPATRVGYLLYPVNFLIWSWLVRSEDEHELQTEAARVLSQAGTAPSRPVPALLGVGDLEQLQ